jgi:hypothetical protein
MTLRFNLAGAVLLMLLVALPISAQSAEPREVPVTIKELDVEAAMHEFQVFQQELERYRGEISEGQKTAVETAQILEELRGSASAENGYNEGKILEAIRGYVEGVVQKQVQLVDFLESQRYRVSYYANQMAASVGPENLVLLFGSQADNVAALRTRVGAVARSQAAIADFVDGLPPGQFDKNTFRAMPGMPRHTRRQLDALLYRYQQDRNARELAKNRLRLVHEMQRRHSSGDPRAPQVDPNLLLGQMFGALDRIRLQLSVDLLDLESFLGRYAQSTRTQEILLAFQRLVEMQGGLSGPSPGLASVLDWLQASSFRRVKLGTQNSTGSGIQIPRSAVLLREAYQAARPGVGNTKPEKRP